MSIKKENQKEKVYTIGKIDQYMKEISGMDLKMAKGNGGKIRMMF